MSTSAPTPEEIGFQNDPDLTPGENAERAIEALSEYVDSFTIRDAEDFVSRNVRGANAQIARRVLKDQRAEAEEKAPEAGFETARGLDGSGEGKGDTEECTGFAGPPEPVVREDGSVAAVFVREDATRAGHPTEIATAELGTWRCQRCDNVIEVGIIDGELVEPSTCEACERQGPFTHTGGLRESDARTAIRAPDLWHPPSGVSEDRFGGLWGDVRDYIETHWDASEPWVYDGLTAFALTTWVRENLTFVPHLMLMGKTLGGKTRLLNTLARVSYRAHVSASATPASMFRLIDAYDVSYFVSEYHGLPYDTQRQLDAVVRAGQKRGEHVDRAEQAFGGQYEPKSFDPFAHIAIATQYTPDDDIVNRCIQIRSSPADEDMPATLDEDRAGEIRDRLLYARFRLLESDEWGEAEADAYTYLADRDITGRTREKLLGLLTVAHIWDHVDELGDFIDAVVQQDRQAAADSEDAVAVEVITELAHEAVAEQAYLGDGDPYGWVEIPYSDPSAEGPVDDGDGIIQRFEDMTGVEKSASWVGHLAKRLGLEKERKRDGTVITDPDLGPKLRELCEEHNLNWADFDSESQHVEEHVTNAVGSGTVVTAAGLASKLGVDEQAAEHGLKNLKDRGDVSAEGDGRFAVN